MREDWQRYKAAAEAIAASMGTTASCVGKYDHLRVQFKEFNLTPEQARAVSVIEDLIALVSEFPPGYLETLEPPA